MILPLTWKAHAYQGRAPSHGKSLSFSLFCFLCLWLDGQGSLTLWTSQSSILRVGVESTTPTSGQVPFTNPSFPRESLTAGYQELDWPLVVWTTDP